MSASSTSSACGAGNPIPMSATSTAPLHTAPSPCSSPGFSAANVTVRSACTASPGAVPAVGVDARGDVDGQDAGARRHAGRVVGAAEPGAVGAVDDEVARWQRDPAADVGRLHHADPGAPPGQEGGGDPAVGAVAALAHHHDDAPAVGAAEQAQRGVRRRRAGAGHQGLVRDGREGGGVGRPHFVAGQDGAHGACSATTKAMATPSVWVSERWKVPAPRAPASSAAAPCRREVRRVARGALPRRPAHLDVGQRRSRRCPVPSAFMTASLAAKRAARLWATSAEPLASERSVSVKQRAREAGAAVEHPPEPRHVDRVDADADDGAGRDRRHRDHSTVTVLARLRGRSGSCPCRRARR